MSTAVKLLCGFSVVAVASGVSLSHLRVADRQAVWASARQALGSTGPQVGPQPMLEPASSVAPASVYGTVAIPKNRLGQYEASVEIDGQSVPMMVDTGATLVVLSFEDADRLGIRPAPNQFDQWVSTANGRAAVARVNIRQMRLDSIVLRDVSALVASRKALASSLLGMTFLGRLRSVRVEAGRLALQQ